MARSVKSWTFAHCCCLCWWTYLSTIWRARAKLMMMLTTLASMFIANPFGSMTSPMTVVTTTDITLVGKTHRRFPLITNYITSYRVTEQWRGTTHGLPVLCGMQPSAATDLPLLLHAAMHPVTMRRIDPAKNVSRFSRLDV